MHYLFFCDWLISLGINVTEFHPYCRTCENFIPFMAEWPHFVHPFIHWWTLVASTFGRLWIMLLWTWVYSYLFETRLSILSSIYPEAEVPDHMVILFSKIFWGKNYLGHNIIYLVKLSIKTFEESCYYKS